MEQGKIVADERTNQAFEKRQNEMKQIFGSNDKKRILPELYFLRAQLSYVSQQKDKIDELGAKRKEQQLKIYKHATSNWVFPGLEYSGGWERTDRLISTDDQIHEYFSSRQDIPDIERVAQDYKDEWESYKKSARIALIKVIATAILAIVAIVGIIVGIYVHVALIVCASIVTAIFTGLVIYFIYCYREEKWHVDSNKEAYLDHEKYLTETRKEYDRQLEIIDKNYNKAIVPFVNAAKSVIDAMTRTYSDVYDRRDWQYLDLIIYYFETNRVSAMREALLLVDTERRNQELMQTVSYATQTVCSSIRESYSTLQSSIEQGFAALQQTMRSGFAQLNAVAMAQLSATNFSNALQTKANATSEQLANDLNYMRSKYFY